MEKKTINQALGRLKNDSVQNVMGDMTEPTERL